MPQPQSWGEVYSLHTSVSVAGDFGRREFAFRLPSTATPLSRISPRGGFGQPSGGAGGVSAVGVWPAWESGGAGAGVVASGAVGVGTWTGGGVGSTAGAAAGVAARVGRAGGAVGCAGVATSSEDTGTASGTSPSCQPPEPRTGSDSWQAASGNTRLTTAMIIRMESLPGGIRRPVNSPRRPVPTLTPGIAGYPARGEARLRRRRPRCTQR